MDERQKITVSEDEEEVLIPKDIMFLFKHIKDEKLFVLPINKIDGITVAVSIRYRKTQHMPSGHHNCFMEMNISAQYKDLFMFGAIADVEEANDDELMMTFKRFYKMILTLKDLKYSHVINRYLLPKESSFFVKNTDTALHQRIDGYKTLAQILKCDNLEIGLVECCVCLTETISTLPCNHHLCMKCENQLKQTKCPMCRKEYHRNRCDCSNCEDYSSEEE
jgi:hypothetical protein